MGLNIPVEARSGSGVTCNKNHSRAARQRDARGGAWTRGVHGGAMRAIYQHRTDNEDPQEATGRGGRRGPGCRLPWPPLTRVAARTPSSYWDSLSGIPAEDSGDEKARPHETPDTSRNNLLRLRLPGRIRPSRALRYLSASVAGAGAAAVFAATAPGNREIHRLPNIRVHCTTFRIKKAPEERAPVYFPIEQKEFNFHEQW